MGCRNVVELGLLKEGPWQLGSNSGALLRTDHYSTQPHDIDEVFTVYNIIFISFYRNIIHGSDSVESANKEIALWFKNDGEVVDWIPAAYKYVYEKWKCNDV